MHGGKIAAGPEAGREPTIFGRKDYTVLFSICWPKSGLYMKRSPDITSPHAPFPLPEKPKRRGHVFIVVLGAITTTIITGQFLVVRNNRMRHDAAMSTDQRAERVALTVELSNQLKVPPTTQITRVNSAASPRSSLHSFATGILYT